MLQITDDQIFVPDEAELSALNQAFQQQHHVLLPAIVEPGFLQQIVALIQEGQYQERLTPNIGCVETLNNPQVEHGMQFLLNQDPIKAAISRIIGKEVHLWLGNTVRRVPGRNHFSNWHDDNNPPLQVGDGMFQRAVPMSVNLSSGAFEGGNLEIRRLPDNELIADIPNKGFGDANLFRIGPGLQHRVADVHGSVPRVVHVGWYHARVS